VYIKNLIVQGLNLLPPTIKKKKNKQTNKNKTKQNKLCARKLNSGTNCSYSTKTFENQATMAAKALKRRTRYSARPD
jgi:hypothetical protein